MIERARIASVQNNGYNIFTEIRGREELPGSSAACLSLAL